MVKNILILVFIFCFFNSYAQEPAYTPMRLNYQFRGIKVDSLFLVPSFTDTTSANSSTMKNVAGAMIRTGNDFWMRNAATTAWLQNVNTGSGASIALNSPDRINGTATNDVTADMDGSVIKFIQVKQFTIRDTTAVNGVFDVNMDDINIESEDLTASVSDTFIINKGKITHITTGNKYEFKDFNNTFLQIDTLGNFTAGDLTKDSLTIVLNNTTDKITFRTPKAMEWSDPVTTFKSQIKTGYPKNDIDLSTGNYEIKLPGVYSVSTAHASNTLILPDPANWGGQSITIINKDGAVAIAYGGGFDPYIYDGSQISTQWISSIVTLYSDSNVWFAIYNK